MKQKKSKITELMALVVFAVFAVCVLAVLLTGAEVYKNLVDRGEEDHASRTAAQYVTTRVRQAESVCVADFGGQDALEIREEIGGSVYVTRVYCHDGFLRELFASESGDFSPEDGEKVLQLQGLSLNLTGKVLTAGLRLPDGTEQTLTLYLRAGEEVLP